MTSNLVLSILVLGSIKAFLDSVKQLQIIVHIFLINVTYPVTATVFFSMLMDVLTFQFHNFSDLYNRVLRLDPDSDGNNPINNQFDLMGYGSLFIIQNFGTLCFTVLFAPILWFTSMIAGAIFKTRLTKYRVKFQRLMFFDYWLSLLGETYLFLAVCTFLNFNYLRWEPFGEGINSFITVVVAICVCVFPFFVAVFYSISKN